MNRDDLSQYDTCLCPSCGAQAPATDVSADENLFPTYYYKCRCGLRWTRTRSVAMTPGELRGVIALTRKLHPELWAER